MIIFILLFSYNDHLVPLVILLKHDCVIVQKGGGKKVIDTAQYTKYLTEDIIEWPPLYCNLDHRSQLGDAWTDVCVAVLLQSDRLHAVFAKVDKIQHQHAELTACGEDGPEQTWPTKTETRTNLAGYFAIVVCTELV